MNPAKSSEQTLKHLFPMLIVLIVLIAGIVIMPTLNADPRSSASEPKPALVTPSMLQNSDNLEIVCAELYNPVCDTATGITYPNNCEANLAGSGTTTPGECGEVNTPILLPTSN